MSGIKSFIPEYLSDNYAMPRRTEKPTDEELNRSLNNIYSEVSKLFCYYIWFTRIRGCVSINEKDSKILESSIVSGFFLSVRELHEFLKGKPEKEAKAGDVFAADFKGFATSAGFLRPDDFNALHKVIGHVTIPEENSDGATGEVFQACRFAYAHISKFLDFLESSYLKGENLEAHRRWKKHLDDLMESYERDVLREHNATPQSQDEP